MNLKQLTDSQLLTETEQAVKIERASTAEVIRLFQEISDRKLYLDRGFPSLFEMATKHFGYCAGSAMRRINSMKLVHTMPEVEEKIETGELSLTVAANLQSFFQTDAKSYSTDEKANLIDDCLGKSTREVEKELARRSPEREKREFARYVTDERIRISFTISEELNQNIERLRSVLSHAEPNASLETLLAKLIELGLDKYDPARKAQRSMRRKAKTHSEDSTNSKKQPVEEPSQALESDNLKTSTALPTQEAQNRTRYIPAIERQAAQLTYDGQGCEYRDPTMQRRCGATHFLQIDHIRSFAEGGPHEAINFQFLCGAHNRQKWQRERGHTGDKSRKAV